MIVEPAPDTVVSLSDAGQLELFSPGTGELMRAGGRRLAMWIALSRNGGRVAEAAGMLSRLLAHDAVDTECELVVWVHDLSERGLVLVR